VDDRALTIWLCQQLGSLDGWQWWESAEPYPAGSVGVHYGRIADHPNRGVGVRVYGGTDSRVTDSKTRRVQLRFRGDPSNPDGADVLADQAFTHLESLLREGVVSEVDRQSFSSAGSDDNEREQRTDNYLIIFDNEEAPS
jgi:hypothetical protein